MPPNAPAEKGARKKPAVRISPTAAATAQISQMSQASIGETSIPGAACPRENLGVGLLLRGHDQGPREIVRVERPEVFERLADPDQLDGDPELAGDGQRDAALGGAVE